MLLAIDTGNTNTVFSVFLGDERIGTWRCRTEGARTSDEYAVWLTHLLSLKGLKPSDIRDCIISSVVPNATPALKQLASQHFGCEALVVEENAVLPISVEVPRPEEVGGDRLVNAVAAWKKYGAPLIIVDLGTATTFDVSNAQGAYIGGVIAPGVNLSAEALYKAAARLPRVDIAVPASVIAQSTVPAMQSGLFWGYLGMVEGLLRRMKTEYAEDNNDFKGLTTVATGGLGRIFSEATEEIDHYDGDLTMDGLRFIYEANKPTRH